MYKKIFILSALVLFFGVSQSYALVPVAKEEQKDTTITTEQDVSSTLDTAESKLKVFYDKYKEKLETFRNKQALYFATLRDQTKVKLGIQVTGDILKELSPMFTPPPAPTPIGSDPNKLGELETKKLDSPMDYVTLIYSTSLASLFASVLMFYGVLAFLLFLLIRVFFRMFV